MPAISDLMAAAAMRRVPEPPPARPEVQRVTAGAASEAELEAARGVVVEQVREREALLWGSSDCSVWSILGEVYCLDCIVRC